MVYTDNFTPTPTTTTTTSTSPSSEPDDISAFLRHLSHRSSAPSTSTSSPSVFHPSLHFPTVIPTHAGNNNHINNNNNNNNNNNTPLTCSLSSPVFPPTAVFSGSDRVTSTATGGYFPVSGGSRLSSNIEYADYCDYESEEGAEGAAADEQQSLSRNQLKRTRAAEVHNLSEKRRRSRINEKMKALQNLIPNSNKTDKASMLDEAIEYLKQLQLQVQMLSMRNGLSLHPMCLPEDQGITNATQLSQIGMHNLNNRSASFDHISITNALNIIPDTLHSTFNLVNQSNPSTKPTLPSHSNVNKSEMTEYTLDQAQDSFVPRQYPPSGCTVVAATLPHSFVAGNSNIERHNTLEPQSQTYYGSGSQGMVVEQQRDSSIFSGLDTASSSAQSDKLTIGR